jgi:uncharacterized protein YggE
MMRPFVWVLGASVAQAFNANAQRVRAVLDVLKQVSNQITVTLGETDRVGALLQTAVGTFNVSVIYELH